MVQPFDLPKALHQASDPQLAFAVSCIDNISKHFANLLDILNPIMAASFTPTQFETELGDDGQSVTFSHVIDYLDQQDPDFFTGMDDDEFQKYSVPDTVDWGFEIDIRNQKFLFSLCGLPIEVMDSHHLVSSADFPMNNEGYQAMVEEFTKGLNAFLTPEQRFEFQKKCSGQQHILNFGFTPS